MKSSKHKHATEMWNVRLPELRDSVVDSKEGLTAAQARARLRRFGANTFRDQQSHSRAVEFLRRFRNPLIIILIAASALAGLTGEIASFVIIVTMVLASVTLDFVQEDRAQRASEQLRKSVQVRASVIRDGVVHHLRVAGIVPGDLVLLQAGSLVPADGLVIEAHDLFVNQSALTGESFPVEKHVQAPPEAVQRPGHGSENVLLMGSSIVSGSGRMLVCRTGTQTALGEISQSLAATPPPTAFEIGTRQFGLLIMRLTMFMVLFVLLVNTITHKPVLESFLFALALAVGLTPELLPMVITVTLSRGALTLARKGVIVKRLAAIQNLGSVDVLCTDKTGTLTEARIHLEQSVDAAGNPSRRAFELAYLNSRFETGLKSPLDDAILERPAPPAHVWTKVDEVPFDFERRRVSVLLDDGKSRLLIVKGAPQDMMRLSSHYHSAGEAMLEWDDEARTLARRQLDALEDQGQRVLAVAYRELPRSHDHAVVSDEAQLVFCGFVSFLDPPKTSAVKALADLSASGVQVKILTGDSERVTTYLCSTLGIHATGTLTGSEIDQMNDDALRASVQRNNLFCRVTPAQKNRIILALKSRAHVVGFVGDGINDAPALHSADVGLSVDTAADVAREAADMILTRHDLRVLHDAVTEGRRTFANVRKYIMMGTSSNFGNMFSMAAASVFLPFLPMLPVQILLNNMLYDISEVAIPLDRVDAEVLKTPQNWDMRFIRNFMLAVGLVSSLFDFLTFYILLAVLHAGEVLFHTGWFIESLVTQVMVIFVIRTRGNPLASQPSLALTVTSLSVAALAIALPLTPWAGPLGFERPSLEFLGLLAGLMAAYLLVVEAVKRWFYRSWAAHPSPVVQG